MSDWTYSTIKAMATDLRKEGKHCTVPDLLALSYQNDPFFSGSPTEIKNGEWFKELWERFQCGQGVHLRRIHYRIVSQEKPVLLPNSIAIREHHRLLAVPLPGWEACAIPGLCSCIGL